MRVVAKPSALLACLVAGGFQLLGLLAAMPAAADPPAIDPTQILQSLSPEQQQSIMNRITGGQGTNPNAPGQEQQRQGMGGPQGERNRPRQSLAQRRAEQEQEEELNTLFPIYRSQDWVVVEADFFLPPRPISLQTLATLGAISSAQNLLAGNAPVLSLAGVAAGTTTQNPAQTASGALAPGAAVVAGAGYAPGAAGAGNGPIYSISGRKLSDDDKQRLQDLIDLIRSKNPYQLTGDGALVLPGFMPIPLLGLTDEQATLRLKAEPALRDIDVRVTRLPLRKTGFEGLKPFGYDLFWGTTSTFAPATNIPVPSDYVVGAGDQLEVQLYGNTNRTLTLTVGRDGIVNLPDIGPVNVGGQLFAGAKATIESRVERQMIGVRANVTMRDIRSITVFVMGDVNTPGSYTIGGLSTVTSALFAAGGIKPIGSMRRIELRRHGALVRTLDLYELLLHGNNAGDARLQQDDVVFIPPVGPTVGVEGEVLRPAIYEVRDDGSVAGAIELAGGLTPEADRAAELTRVDATQHRVVLAVDLRSAESSSQRVRNGDRLRVDRLRPTLDAAVVVQGHVFTPGAFAYRAGMRLSDVFNSVDQLRPGADIHYLLIRRETPPDARVSVVSADLAAALNAPGSPADVPLAPRDRITVFDLTSGRDHLIQSLLGELRAESTAARPPTVVHVEGRVRVPGDYPLEPGMRVTDLVRAGGGLADEAYSARAELARYRVENGVARRTEIHDIDLALAMRGDGSANLVLEPFDDLSVKEISLWGQQATVTLEGEVRFPGSYPIRQGETLRSVIARAGGLTDFAFPEGSVFTREELKRREQEQIDLLVTRTQADLTAQGGQPTLVAQPGVAASLAMGQSLLAQLKAAKPVGRLVIDLPRAMHLPPGSVADVILRDGDRLIVPRFQQQVTVIGEVQNATSLLYHPDQSRDGYIEASGGLTRMADTGRIYVVRANGSVVSRGGSRWFQHSASGVEIKPGDTIVVPLDTEHLPALPFWQAVTGILYNVAIAVAAVHSFH
jgi:protein involved in polysaccharide export with SLBB domain